jgi:hypothetical protein
MEKYIIRPSDEPESKKARCDFYDIESLKRCAQREHAKAFKKAIKKMFEDIPEPKNFKGMS